MSPSSSGALSSPETLDLATASLLQKDMCRQEPVTKAVVVLLDLHQEVGLMVGIDPGLDDLASVRVAESDGIGFPVDQLGREMGSSEKVELAAATTELSDQPEGEGRLSTEQPRRVAYSRW